MPVTQGLRGQTCLGAFQGGRTKIHPEVGLRLQTFRLLLFQSKTVALWGWLMQVNDMTQKSLRMHARVRKRNPYSQNHETKTLQAPSPKP